MKLMVITQIVDRNDPILGFFHQWLTALADKWESVTVISLYKGEYDLPKNVKVLSLGKEGGSSRLKYLYNFYKYIWQERENYDAVFVHMNQEYALLGGILWRLWGKRVALWRNHAKGNMLTDIAAALSDKVFCTSPSSYTAKFSKTKIMPVGIDTEFFKPDPEAAPLEDSILFLGRISPVKRVLEFIEWFYTLDPKFTATIAGSTPQTDKGYEEEVRSRAKDRIRFTGSVNQDEALRLYQTHETYVNMTPAGSFDKTIFEAAACEMKIIVENKDLKDLESKSGEELRKYVLENHSLDKLMNSLVKELNG